MSMEFFLLLAAILKISSNICALLGKAPPGCFSWHCWSFPPTGHVGEQPTAFHLNIFPVKPTSLPHHSHQWHGCTGGSSTTPTEVHATASCTLQFWTPAASVPLLWENRDNREGSFLSLMHPVSPRLACEKGFCCIGGICWSEAEVALCAQGGLSWDKHPEASTPARSTHSQPVLCHPQDPEASRSLRALR